jgi:hypothetical protein
MTVCECCGQEVPTGLRPPDSRGNGAQGWRISFSDQLSHWVYQDPNGRYYEFKWHHPGVNSTDKSCEWISDDEAERLIRSSCPLRWGRGT